jgi:glycine hydroxymethyltransferase
MHIIAAKAVCLKEAAEPAFAEYQRRIVANAKTLAAALVAAGFRLVSGGTDNHLMLVDVFSKGITGKVAEAALGKAASPSTRTRSPSTRIRRWWPAGFASAPRRLRRAAWASARWRRSPSSSRRALQTPEDDGALAKIRTEVETLCRKFPLYPE